MNCLIDSIQYNKFQAKKKKKVKFHQKEESNFIPLEFFL